jgi:hypothetical protein
MARSTDFWSAELFCGTKLVRKPEAYEEKFAEELITRAQARKNIDGARIRMD